MTPFDLLKRVYNKEHPDDTEVFDIGICILLNRWLCMDPECAGIVKTLVPYMLYIEPKHYFYLLFLSIPKRNKYPYFKTKKTELVDNPLVNRIQYLLDWTNRDVQANRTILDKVILPKADYWEKELGLK